MSSVSTNARLTLAAGMVAVLPVSAQRASSRATVEPTAESQGGEGDLHVGLNFTLPAKPSGNAARGIQDYQDFHGYTVEERQGKYWQDGQCFQWGVGCREEYIRTRPDGTQDCGATDEHLVNFTLECETQEQSARFLSFGIVGALVAVALAVVAIKVTAVAIVSKFPMPMPMPMPMPFKLPVLVIPMPMPKPMPMPMPRPPHTPYPPPVAPYPHATFTPTVCQPGGWNTNGASHCKTCPAGTFSLRGAERCTTCNAGTYSHQGAGKCTPCPRGTYSKKGAKKCMKCDRNEFSTKGAAKCTPCKEGKSSKKGSGKCTPTVTPYPPAEITEVRAKSLSRGERLSGRADRRARGARTRGGRSERTSRSSGTSRWSLSRRTSEESSVDGGDADGEEACRVGAVSCGVFYGVLGVVMLCVAALVLGVWKMKSGAPKSNAAKVIES